MLGVGRLTFDAFNLQEKVGREKLSTLKLLDKKQTERTIAGLHLLTPYSRESLSQPHNRKALNSREERLDTNAAVNVR